MSESWSWQKKLSILWVVALLATLPTFAHEPDYTAGIDRDRCTFTSTGSHPYFPLWPGYSLRLEGEEEDDGEILEVATQLTITHETEVVDGVRTRVVIERETEDGELVEISRNFMAMCRETGDVWYFGEDVEDYEDGEVVGSEGAWRAGVDGAEAGILMPGTPLLGARYFQELAPGVAEDLGEVTSLDSPLEVPYGAFPETLYVVEGSGLDPEDFSEKWYAPGLGLIKDDVIELVAVTPPSCRPDGQSHCLADGRFRVRAEWDDGEGNEGAANAILSSADSGEFWFFDDQNTELIVKVLDGCGVPGFNSFWVFAAGLTNVEVTIEVTDTATGATHEYENPFGRPFQPILDTSTFTTCP